MTQDTYPKSVADLVAAYGPPSQAAFGSAVFYQEMKPGDDLEKAALAIYKHFVGETWARFGEDAWMSVWRKVYERKAGARHDIVAELRGLQGGQVESSVELVLDNVENAEEARKALAAVYDDPAMTDLAVYSIGDGDAMSGILVAGRQATGETTYLSFLLD
jgi:hypothetical protein